MKVKFKDTKVIIEMSPRQLKSLFAVFDSFSDQVMETNSAYGDCIRNIDRLRKAVSKAKGSL